jgi:hypothetical protein
MPVLAGTPDSDIPYILMGIQYLERFLKHDSFKKVQIRVKDGKKMDHQGIRIMFIGQIGI